MHTHECPRCARTCYCTAELCLKDKKTCDDCRDNFRHFVALFVFATGTVLTALLLAKIF